MEAKSLLILDSEYNLEEINDKWRAKNIIIKELSFEAKELINNLILETIIVNSEYVKFISLNTNVKLFCNEEELISHGYNYLVMKKMLNNNESKNNINKQLIESSEKGSDYSTSSRFLGIRKSETFSCYLEIVKLLINMGANVKAQDNEAIIGASKYGNLEIIKLLIENGAAI